MTERCSADVQNRLFAILERGILNIRMSVEENAHQLCAIEADHLHNIPGLIKVFSTERLAYYLNVEVAQYVREAGDKVWPDMFKDWAFLKEWLDSDSPREA